MTKQQAPKTVRITEAQLDAAMEEVTAPLLATIADLSEKLAAAAIPAVVVPVVDGNVFRATYIAAKAAASIAHKAYLAALKGGVAAAECARAEWLAKVAIVTAMSEDMNTREHIADFLFNTADGTRTQGHKAVNAVADVMHKAVDHTANGIEAVGRFVQPKAKDTTPSTTVVEILTDL